MFRVLKSHKHTYFLFSFCRIGPQITKLYLALLICVISISDTKFAANLWAKLFIGNFFKLPKNSFSTSFDVDMFAFDWGLLKFQNGFDVDYLIHKIRILFDVSGNTGKESSGNVRHRRLCDMVSVTRFLSRLLKKSFCCMNSFEEISGTKGSRNHSFWCLSCGFKTGH